MTTLLEHLLEDAERIADDISAASDGMDEALDEQESTFLEMASVEAVTLDGVQAKARALETASFVACGAIDHPSDGEQRLLLSLLRDLLSLT